MTKRPADDEAPDPLTMHGADPVAARCIAAEASAALGEGAKKPKTVASVPIINLTPFFESPGTEDGRQSVAAAVAEACEHVGFLVVTGHGVDIGELRKCAADAKAFFACENAEKMKVAANGRAYGYFPMDSEALGYDANVAKRPDLREAFSMGPHAPLPPPGQPGAPEPSEVVEFCYQPTPWPEKDGLKESMIKCYDTMGKLADRLLCVFARILGVDVDFFLSKTTHHASSLRVIHYPKLEAEPVPGQLRCGAHSDICTITILWQDVHGGLEVLPRGHDEWVAVHCPEDGFIVNLGDLFARWTNDRWLSTPHRVVCPRLDDPVQNVPRISMPYFQILNSDAEVACFRSCLQDGEEPKHAPTTQGEDLMTHFKRWGRNRGD